MRVLLCAVAPGVLVRHCIALERAHALGHLRAQYYLLIFLLRMCVSNTTIFFPFFSLATPILFFSLWERPPGKTRALANCAPLFCHALAPRMHAATPPNVVWVAARSDSLEYQRYEAMERQAHEASRAARAPTDRIRVPGAPLGADHVRDMAVINAQRPAAPGVGLYLFSIDNGVGITGTDGPPSLCGWLSESEALAWLDAFYPHSVDTARACMITCSGDGSLCACGVVDPAVGNVRFYAVAAQPPRRRKRRPHRNRIGH